nr:Na+/H+ antiporter NhaA [uncultured Azohydromonas sp.]
MFLRHARAGGSELASANSIGIAAVPLIGEPSGITLTCFTAVALDICNLPLDLSWRHIFGAGLLGALSRRCPVAMGDLVKRLQRGTVVPSPAAVHAMSPPSALGLDSASGHGATGVGCMHPPGSLPARLSRRACAVGTLPIRSTDKQARRQRCSILFEHRREIVENMMHAPCPQDHQRHARPDGQGAAGTGREPAPGT